MCTWYWFGVNCKQHNTTDVSDCFLVMISKLLKHGRMHLTKQQASSPIRSGFECDWKKQFLAINNCTQGCRHFGNFPCYCWGFLRCSKDLINTFWQKRGWVNRIYLGQWQQSLASFPPIMGKSFTVYDLKVYKVVDFRAMGFSRSCCTTTKLCLPYHRWVQERHTSGIYWRRHWNWSKMLNDASSPSCTSDLLHGHQQLVSRLSSPLLCIPLSPFECKAWTHLLNHKFGKMTPYHACKFGCITHQQAHDFGIYQQHEIMILLSLFADFGFL